MRQIDALLDFPEDGSSFFCTPLSRGSWIESPARIPMSWPIASTASRNTIPPDPPFFSRD
jgi:hypothetical protein